MIILELPQNFRTNYLDQIIKGFYPRIYQYDIKQSDFYPSYLQTYIERDIRTLKSIENLSTFTRFFNLCAGRTGQILNLSSLASDAGISVNTAKSWLSLLEASFIVYLLKPYHRNFNKRIIKSPKLYFYDTGVVCSLLRINDSKTLYSFPIYGSIFENLVISEIIKIFYHHGIQPNIFYWKESNGTEIDCIIEKSFDEIIAIEIKGGETFNKDYLKNLIAFKPKTDTIKIIKYLVHPEAKKTQVNDITIINWEDLTKELLYHFQ